MDSSQITEALLAFGPWAVLAVTFAETVFVTGFVVPALPTIMAACILALDGYFSLGSVALAAIVGGLLGDTGGFWIGRKGGRRLLAGGGRLRGLARTQEQRVAGLIDRHSGLAVTIGRLIAFVRTAMPIAAGLSDLPYRRFLLYDALGVLLWATAYVGLGVGAAAGWQRVRSELGMTWAISLVVLGLVVWVGLKMRRVSSGHADDAIDPPGTEE